MTARKGLQRLSPERRARIRRALLRQYGPLCQICRILGLSTAEQRIDMDAPPGATRGWSVDHIVKWAQGGTNQISNLWPAHLACNNHREDV